MTHWRAVCGESRKHGSEGGCRKSAQRQLACCLPYNGAFHPACGFAARWSRNGGGTRRPTSIGLRWKGSKTARRLASCPVRTRFIPKRLGHGKGIYWKTGQTSSQAIDSASNGSRGRDHSHSSLSILRRGVGYSRLLEGGPENSRGKRDVCLQRWRQAVSTRPHPEII